MEVNFEFEWWPKNVKDFEERINKVFSYHLDFILEFKNSVNSNSIDPEDFEDEDCSIDSWITYVKFKQLDIYDDVDKVIDEFQETDNWKEANEDDSDNFSEQGAFIYMEEWVGNMWYEMLQLTDIQIKDKYRLTQQEKKAKENRESSIDESEYNLNVIFELVEKEGYSLEKVCQEFLIESLSKQKIEVSIDESEQNLEIIFQIIKKYGYTLREASKKFSIKRRK